MRRTTESGLTLLELLVAMALALSVMGTVLGVLLSARQSLVHAREAAQLQESARFLLEYLSEQIRGAGYSGCSSRSPIALGAAATAFFDAPGITGYDYDAGRASFPVEFRAALRAGNDALLVRTGMAISGESPIRGQAVIASTATVRSERCCDGRSAQCLCLSVPTFSVWIVPLFTSVHRVLRQACLLCFVSVWRLTVQLKRFTRSRRKLFLEWSTCNSSMGWIAMQMV